MKLPMQKRVLTISAIAIIIIIALVAIISLNQVKKVDTTTKDLIQTQDLLLQIQQLTALTVHFEIDAKSFSIKENADDDFKKQSALITYKISALKKEKIANPEEQFLIDSFITAITSSLRFSEKIIDAKKNGKLSRSSEIIVLNESKLKKDSVKSFADKVDVIENRRNQKEETDIINEVKTLKNIFYVRIGVIIILGLIVFYKLRSDLSRQRKLNEQLSYMAALMNQTGDAIVSSNNEIIQTWNKGAEKIYGYKQEEAVGKNVYSIIRTKMNEAGKKEFATTIENKGKWDGEVIHTNKNGDDINLLVSITKIDDKNSNTFYVSIAKDISQKKKDEEKIKHLASVIQSTNDAIYTTDNDFCIKSWNKGAEKMYGYTEDEILGKVEYKVLPAYHPVFSVQDVQNFEKQGYYKTESTHRKKNGQVFIVTISVTYLKDENEITNGFIIVVNDITEVKQLEGKLKNFNEKLETEVIAKTKELNDVFGRVTEGFIALNNQKCFTYVNKRAGEIFKRDWRNLIGKNIEEELGEIGENFFKAYEKTIKTQQYIYFEDFFTNFNSWIEIHFYPAADGVSVYFKDVTEQKNIQENLIKLNYRFRNLASHLQNSREEERINIAREIHDELGQMATAIKIDLSWMKKKIKGDNEEVKAKMDNTILELGDMVNSIRRIAQELRPSILDNLGLTAAIEWYCGDFQKRTTIQCKFNNEIGDVKLSDNVKTNLFRICQESLTNVMRHSSATKVECTIQKEGNKIILIVIDNGEGFDTSQKTKSLGLLGMQERALLINGELTIESSKENGTRIKVEVEL